MTRDPALPVVLAFAAVAVAGVLLRPAVPIDETRYLAVAWEMHSGGNWLVPTRNFEIYTDKPPILFWAINLVWLATGVSETAARLVGPAFAVLALLLTGRLAGRLWPEVPGIAARATIALAGMQVFAFYGGLTMFDAALAAATVGGVLAVVRALDTGRRRHWAGLGVALAAGGLIKGPVILVHLLPVVLLAPFWARGRAAAGWREVGAGLGIAVGTGLGLVALWLVPAVLTGGPDYRDAILWTQSAGRISSSFAHAKPWWFFAALLPLLLFPWIFVPGLWRAGLRAQWRDPALRLCLVWAGSAFVLFSLISGKQIHYLIPELPAAALVVGRLAPDRARLWVPAAVHLALALVGLAVVAGLLSLGKADSLAEPRTAVLAWSFLVAAVCIAALREKGLAGGAILTLGTILAFNLLFGLAETRRAYDSHPIAQALAPYAAQGLAFYGQEYHAEFNFAGRFTEPVANPPDAPALATWRRAHPEGAVVARLDRAHPHWPHAAVIGFRNAPYAIWRVADAPDSEPMS